MLEDQFWLKRSLEQMSQPEWEAICDGCGKCCLNTFIDSEDEDEFTATDQLREGEELIFTNIVCQYLDNDTCGCSEYANRQTLVPSCVKLTKENLKDIFFMPTSCSYRRLQEGRGLPSWHPLLNGGKKSLMHKKQMSVRNKTISERAVNFADFEDHIVSWPLNDLD